jgi:hypothetical protein
MQNLIKFSSTAHECLTGYRHRESVTVIDAPPARRGGPADICYVLTMLQVAFLLLAGLAESLLMGNGGYLLMPILKAIVLLILAARIVSGKRWAAITMIVVQSLTLAAFGIQLLLAFVPAIALTVNLAGITTNLVMPIAMIILCRQAMPAKRRRIEEGPTAGYPVPQDPYAQAPIVDDAATLRTLATPTGPIPVVPPPGPYPPATYGQATHPPGTYGQPAQSVERFPTGAIPALPPEARIAKGWQS